MDLPDKEKKEVHESFSDGIKRNEELFENKITYLSGGAIALLLSFVSEKSILDHLVLFFATISFFVTSLIVNLFSTLYASQKAWSSQKENAGKDDVCKLNKSVRLMNWISFGALTIGVILVIIFINTNQKLEDMHCKKCACVYHGDEQNVETRGLTLEVPYESSQAESSEQGSSQGDND